MLPYSKEEFARRGDETYERDIRPQVEAAHSGAFVAIDIETEMYELNPDDYTATEHLIRRKPDAQIWLLRVGRRGTYSMGGVRPANFNEASS